MIESVLARVSAIRTGEMQMATIGFFARRKESIRFFTSGIIVASIPFSKYVQKVVTAPRPPGITRRSASETEAESRGMIFPRAIRADSTMT